MSISFYFGLLQFYGNINILKERVMRTGPIHNKLFEFYVQLYIYEARVINRGMNLRRVAEIQPLVQSSLHVIALLDSSDTLSTLNDIFLVSIRITVINLHVSSALCDDKDTMGAFYCSQSIFLLITDNKYFQTMHK